MEPPAPAIDLAATLAEALQYKTVSYDEAPPDPEEQARAFDSFHAFLRRPFRAPWRWLNGSPGTAFS